MSRWIDEWDRNQTPYVNRRHRDRHFRRIGRQTIALVPPGGSRVLDFGPGDALHAVAVAEAVGEVVLCEAAAHPRARLGERFRRSSTVTVLDPPDLGLLPAGSVDLVIAHSVSQYLDDADLDTFLVAAARLLTPDGVLVLGDVVPPGSGVLSDVGALLRAGARDGFLVAAVLSLVRSACSGYGRTRSRLGLRRFAPSELTARAARVGLSGGREPCDLGDHPRRWTFVARPVGQG